MIEKCIGAGCESSENIEKFISDLEIETWVWQEKIDILEYDVKPVFKTCEII